MPKIFIFLSLLLVAHADIPFVTGTSIPPQANNGFNGEYGSRFRNLTGETLVITQLGRWVVAGNTQPHTVTIYSDYYVNYGSVVINTAGQPSGVIKYETLSTPVNIAPGELFYILSTETAGGDNSNLAFSPTGYWVLHEDVAYVDSGFYNTTTSSLSSLGGTDRMYGPVSFQYTSPLKTWTKDGNVYTTDGTYYQLYSAIQDATAGDIVFVPNGTYEWGGGGNTLNIKAGVTLMGESEAGVIINMSSTSPAGYGGSLIVLNDGSAIRRMTFNGPDVALCNLVRNTSGTNDWRVSEITYNQYVNASTPRASYFVLGQKVTRALIDNCTILGGAGNSELVYAKGPDNAWDVAHTMGGADNIFIEDCTWNGTGYVSDANSNGRMVVRNNTINGSIKVDGHGVWTNGGPVRGVRHMEVYRNDWFVSGAGNYPAIEIRGGGGRVWGNTSNAPTADNKTWLFITEYGYFSNNGAFSPNYQTPYAYPVRDQIGRGMYSTPGDWTTATSEPMYLWSNVKGGNPWPWSYKTIVAGAQTRYSALGGTPPFVWEDVIQADRDYFNQATSFNGSTGVGVGTYAAMMAITPSKTGVGFWVTDQADWDSVQDGNDGQLYVWDGDSWELDYTPYTYPHPMRADDDGPPPPDPEDETAPTPSPLTLSSVTVHDATSITVLAGVATDADSPPVEYAFSSTNGSSWTSWQSGSSYTFTGLTAATTYQFKVKARDSSENLNETTASSATAGTTSVAPTNNPSDSRRALLGAGF